VDVANPGGGVGFEPSVVAIQVTRIRGTLEGIVDVEMIVVKLQTGADGNHVFNLEASTVCAEDLL
jgi:hypothetical protein